MSLADLLPTIRALPRVERVQLMHALVDELTRPDLPSDDVIQGAMFMQAIHGPDGVVMAAAMMQALEDHKNGMPGL